ncbi:MAG: hypothetical protein J6Z22_05510, partial [Lachnospiraceae bacterium]|nr:hypothetical protein [Lachnospiraceae bacterium]
MAEGFSILDKLESPHTDAPRPAFYLDLNINQIIDKVTNGWSNHVKKLYLYFPRNEECEAYRRAVFGDVKKGACYDCLFEFYEKAGVMNSDLKQSEAVNTPLQRFVWHLWAIRHYCEAYEGLLEKLKAIDLTSEGMKEFRRLLEEHITSKNYAEMRSEVFELLEELMHFRFVITYEKDRISVSEGTTEGAYEAFVEKGGDKDR